jgi:hypothetical protein
MLASSDPATIRELRTTPPVEGWNHRRVEVVSAYGCITNNYNPENRLN